jgi:integrase
MASSSESAKRPERKKYPEKALSATKVRNIAKPGRYADGNGMYLVVDPSGAKRFILRTLIHGKRCDIGLGGLSVVSLAEAREEAMKLRKIARAGGDPLAERRKERRMVPTFEQAARQVHAEQSKAFRNAKHAAQWLTTLENYAFPFFGAKRIDLVDSADVLKALSPIWMDKPETARRVKQRMKTVFDWAKASGYRMGDNPTDGITKVLPKHETKHEHHLALPYVQVPAFITALRECSAAASVKLAFEFMILSVLRTAEVLFAKWSEIDMDARTWTVPATRGDEPGMKMKQEHRVPLSARCIQILQEAKTISNGSPYIFSGRTPSKPLSDMVFNMALRRMQRSDCTPHGFRSSFRDWSAEKTNFPNEVCEAALAHKLENKTEEAYRRTDFFEKRRRLMEAWSSFATASGVKVVTMEAKA